MLTLRPLFAVVALLALSALPARAQEAPLSRILVDFFSEGVRMTSGSGAAGNPHEVHFIPGFSQQVTPFELQKSLLNQLSTFPLGTSSGGFTYTLDSSTGAITAASSSFGPSFAERALTIGRGRFNAGFNYQHVEHDKFEDVDLDGRNLVFLLPHNDCCPAGVGIPTNPGNSLPTFEGDLIEARFSMDMKTDTAVVFANYGVTDNLELGVAVPFVRSDVRVGGRFTILRLATSGTPLIHSWDGQGQTIKDVPEAGGSRSGIGDVLVRGKYVFVPNVLATGVDVRLPTGDSLNFLGTGATQTRVTLIVGASGSNLSPHVNLSYTFTSGELDTEAFDIHVPATVPGAPAIAAVTAPSIDMSIPDEFGYTFGLDWAAHPRVTIVGDIIGRTIRDAARYELSNTSYQYRLVADGPLLTETREQLNLRGTSNNLNLVLGAVGAKVNVATNLLLTGNVLFPITKAGLRPAVTPIAGLEYAF